MDRIIEVKVNGGYLSLDSRKAGNQYEANITNLRITFDPSWDGYAKTVTFRDAKGLNPVKRILTADLLDQMSASTRVYMCPIPGEAMTESGMMSFSITGYVDGARQMALKAELEVEESFLEEGGDSVDPTPSQAEQIQVQIDTLLNDIQEEAIRAEEAAEEAKQSENFAAMSAAAAQTAADSVAASEANAKASEEAAQNAAEIAEGAMAEVVAAKTAAEAAAAGAKVSETNAQAAGAQAVQSAADAKTSATHADVSAQSAAAYASNAANYEAGAYAAKNGVERSQSAAAASAQAAYDSESAARAAKEAAAKSAREAAESAAKAGEIAGGDLNAIVVAQLAEHNQNAEAHADIREMVEGITPASIYAQASSLGYISATDLFEWASEQRVGGTFVTNPSHTTQNVPVAGRRWYGTLFMAGFNCVIFLTSVTAGYDDYGDTYVTAKTTDGWLTWRRLATTDYVGALTPGSIGAADADHTHTPAGIGAAAAVHTHTPESIGAQPAATAINTGNIGSQSVNHANSAGKVTGSSYGDLIWSGDHFLNASDRPNTRLHFGSSALHRYDATAGKYHQIIDVGNKNLITPADIGATRIATGSYVGTGAYGEANALTLSFDFPVKLLVFTNIVEASGSYASPPFLNSAARDCYIICRVDAMTTEYMEGFGFGYDQNERPFAKRSVDGKSVTWYQSESGSNMFNKTGCTYHYVAFG